MADVGVGTKCPTTLTNGTSAASTSSESDKENMPNTLSCDFDTLYKSLLDNVKPPEQVKSWDSSSASSSTRLDPLTENTPVPFTRSNSNPHVMTTDNGKGMQQLNRLVKMMEQMCVLTEQNTKLREQANYYSAMKDLERLRNENMNKKYCDRYGKFDDDYYDYQHRAEEVVSEPESIAGEDINSARERSNIKRKGRSTARTSGSKRSRSHGRVIDDKKGILNFVHKITSKNKKQGTKMEDGKLGKLKNKKDSNYGGNERFEDSGIASFDQSDPSYFKKCDSDTEDVFDKQFSSIDSEGFINTKESDLSTASSNDELLESPGKSSLQRRDHMMRGVRHKKGNLPRQFSVMHDGNEQGIDYHSGHKRALSFDAIECNDRAINSQMRKSDTQPDIQAGLAQQEQSNQEKHRRFIENKSASSDMLVSSCTLASKSTSNEKRGKVTSGWDQIKYFIRNKPPGQSEGQLDGCTREAAVGKSVTLATGTEISKEFPSTTWYVALGDTNQALARSVPDNVHKAELSMVSSPDPTIESLQKSLPVDFSRLMEEWDRKRLSGSASSTYTAPEKPSNKKRKGGKSGKKPNRTPARNTKKDKSESKVTTPDIGQRNSQEQDGQLGVGQEVDMSKLSHDFKLKYKAWEEKQKKKQLVRVKSDSQTEHQSRMRPQPQRSASTDLELVGQFVTAHASPAVVQSPQDIVPMELASPVVETSPDVVSNGRSSQDELDQMADSASQTSVPSMNIASDNTSTSEIKSEENFEDGILPDVVDTAESHITKLEEMNLLLANELNHKTANLQQITEEIQKMQEEIAQLGTDITNENRLSNASMGVALEQELCNIKSEVLQLEERFHPTDTPPVKESTEDVSKVTQTQEKKADDEKKLEESLRERETLVQLLQSEISRQANEINYLRSHHRVSRRGKSFCGSERSGKTVNKKRSNSDRIRRSADEAKIIIPFAGASLKEEVALKKVTRSKEATTSTANQSDASNTTGIKPSDRPVSLISTEHDGAISLTASGSSKYERPLSMISGCTVISERERPVSIASSLASSGSTRLEVVTSDSTPSLETLHISAEDIRLSEILPVSEERKVETQEAETPSKRDVITPIPITRQRVSRTACQPPTRSQNTDASKPPRRNPSIKNNSEQELAKGIKEDLKESEEKKDVPPLSPSRLTKIEPQIELVKLAKSPQSQKVDVGQNVTADSARQRPEIPDKRMTLEKRESIKRLLKNNAEKRKAQETFAKKAGERFNGKVVSRRATSDDIQSTPVVKDSTFRKRRDSFESLARLSSDGTQTKSDHSSNQVENQVENLKQKFMQNRSAKNNITETPQSVNSLKPRSYRTKRELPKEGCVKQLSQAFSLGSLDETSTPQSLSPASSCSSIPVIGYSSTVANHIRRLKSRTTESSFDDGRLERPKSDPRYNEYGQLEKQTNESHRKSSPDLSIRKQDEQERSKPSPSREKPAVPRKKSQSSIDMEDKKARRNGSVFTYTVSVDNSGDKSNKDPDIKADLASADRKSPQTQLVNVKPDAQTEESVTFTINKRTGPARKKNAAENHNNNNSSPSKRSQRRSVSDRKQLFENEGAVNKPSTPRNIAVEISKLNNLALVGGKEEEDDANNKPATIASSPPACTEKMTSSGSERSLSSSEKMSSPSPKKTSPKKTSIKGSPVVSKEETAKAVVQRPRQRKPSTQESNNNNRADLNTNNNNSKTIDENSVQPAVEKRHKKNSKIERKESRTKHDVQKTSKEAKTEKRVRERNASTSRVEPSDIKASKTKQNKERKSSKDATEGVTNKRWSFTGKHREESKVDCKQTQTSDKGKKRSSSKQRSNGSTDSLFSKGRESKNSKERGDKSSKGAEAQAGQHRKGSTESKDGSTETNEPQERRSRIDRPSSRSRLRNRADRVPFLDMMKRSPSVDGSNMAKDRFMKQRRPDLLERAQSVDRTITKREKSPSVERKGERSKSSWFSKKTDTITNFLRISNVDDGCSIVDWSEYLDFCQEALDYLHGDYAMRFHSDDVWQLRDELRDIRETSILT